MARHTRAFLNSIAEIDHTICNVCGVKSEYHQLDRRIPSWWNGEYTAANVHWLCIGCHQEKSRIENRFRHHDLTHHDRWSDMAFSELVRLCTSEKYLGRTMDILTALDIGEYLEQIHFAPSGTFTRFHTTLSQSRCGFDSRRGHHH